MKLELQELKKIITASMLIKTEEEKEILDFHLSEEKLNGLHDGKLIWVKEFAGRYGLYQIKRRTDRGG